MARAPVSGRLWDYLRGGGKRAIAVWHRRAGKDDVALHNAAIAMQTRVGNTWHCLPEYLQGRKAIWKAVNPHTGKRRIDEAFPQDCARGPTTTRCSSASKTDHVADHRLRQLRRDGGLRRRWELRTSEWALAQSVGVGLSPADAQENNGWALFITTPRGRNHAKSMYDYAVQDPGWFAEMLTVHDTGALTSEQCAETMREYAALYGADVGRAQFEQEYLCSFNAAILGAFYALEMAQVRSEGRILPIEPPPGALVHRSWDLGVGHSTSIWFFCVVGPQVYVLDHYAASGVGLEHYRDVIEQLYAERGWQHGTDFVPHDARVHEFGTGRTRVETMQRMGLAPMQAPDVSLEDGINAVRRTLPLCVFHPRCETSDISGIGALEMYRREVG